MKTNKNLFDQKWKFVGDFEIFEKKLSKGKFNKTKIKIDEVLNWQQQNWGTKNP